MKLLIAERVRENRKRLGWTQEDLAGRIGVTPQTVSWWENGGYPDITMLPVLADLFGLTVDELMGIDAERFRRVSLTYRDAMNSLPYGRERFHLARNMLRQYPSDLCAALETVLYYPLLPKDEQTAYAPAAKDAARKILSSPEPCPPENRLAAIRLLAETSEGEEREKWIGQMSDTQAYTAVLTRYNIADRDMEQDALPWLGLDSLFKLRFVLHAYGLKNAVGPQNAEAKERFFLNLLDGFGNGKTPDGWLNTRGERLFHLAAALFAQDRTEEGFSALEESLACFRRWHSFPEGSPLDLGAPWLFFGIRGSRAMYRFFLPDGSTYEAFPHDVFPTPALLFMTLTDPSEHWFDGAREDPRYVKIVSGAEDLTKE